MLAGFFRSRLFQGRSKATDDRIRKKNVLVELSLERLRIAMLKANYDATMALAGLLETSGQVEKIQDYLESGK